MKVIILGTSSGMPTRYRYVSASAFIPDNGKSWYLIDCGEGAQYQLIKSGLSILKLQAIFITHVHGDHCYGLPGLLSSMTMLGRTQTLQIFAPDGIKQFVESSLMWSDSHLGFSVDYNTVVDNAVLQENQQCVIRSVPLSHRVPSYAYAFIESQPVRSLWQERLLNDGIARGPLWGKIKKGGIVVLDDGRQIDSEHYLKPAREPRVIVVAGDNDSPEKLDSLQQDIDLLVHEATYTADLLAKIGAQSQHSSAANIAHYAARANIKHLVLTHFSARYSEQQRKPGQLSIDCIAQEARKNYAHNLYLARDLDCFELDSQRQLIKSNLSY